MQVKKQQLEPDMKQQTGSKLRKEYVEAFLSHCLFNLHAEYIMWNAGLDDSQAGIKIAGRNINFRYANDTTLMDMGLITLWEVVKDKEADVLQSMGSQKVRHEWVTE